MKNAKKLKRIMNRLPNNRIIETSELQILPKIIVVLGPTASGKSALAVRLAQEFDGEVVSADSRQVYKGLQIGTGKITKREMEGIPHHMLDVVSPRRQFTAAEYVKKARTAIDEILKRKRLPIIAGGTGFYIDVLLGDMTLAPVSPDKNLRKRLEKETTGALVEKLKKLDPVRAKTIDTRNRVRLIRAIEIAQTLTSADWTRTYAEKHPQKLFDVLKIGITMPKELLRKRIQKRLKARLKQGMIAEAKHLHAKGLSWKRMEELGLEYRFLARLLQKKISEEEMAHQLETAIWRYAKRQMTWWKRDKKIRWFSLNKRNTIKKTISSFLFHIPNSKFQIPNSNTGVSPE